MNLTVKKIAVISMLTAIAVALSIVESFIPSIGIPGIKLGFANILILLAMVEIGPIEALFVSIIRIIIMAIFRGSFLGMGFLMSITGGLLSYTGMYIFCKLFKKFSIIGISVIGSILHVFGQILIAMIYLGTTAVIYYLPFIGLSALGTGVLVGFVVKAVQKTNVIKHILK